MKKDAVIKIFAQTHLHPVIIQNDVITPMQIGKALSDKDMGYVCDNTGDNISEKREVWGGLTAYYWAWKNLKDVDYIGFCHYRRYFLIDEKHNYPQVELVTDEAGLKKLRFDPSNLYKWLDKYDVILSRKKYFIRSIWTVFAKMHDERDFIILEEVLSQQCPDYLPVFYKFIKKNNRLPQFGMLITNFEIFKGFCEWLFPIMEELEKRSNIKENSLSSARKIDFISEHLMSLYFYKNQYKIKYLPIVVADPSKKRVCNLRYFCSCAKSTLRFWLNI